MFAKRLVLLRKNKNLSQYELARLLNLTRGQIANYEQGKRQPDYDTLKMFAEFFNVSTDYLLGLAGKQLSQAGGKVQLNEARPAYGDQEQPDLDYILQEKTLADAMLKISELLFRIDLDDETLLKLIRKATEKYGLPKVENSEPAAHGPKIPGTGVFDDNGHT